jgi:hypothetical protein
MLPLAILLVLWPVPARAVSDAELGRIEALLSALGQSQDLEFIRNGKAYPAGKAVSHLRTKLNHVKGKLSSAEEFIDEVASGSSLSGKPYQVRLADGTEITANEYFHSLLREIDQK